MVAMHSFCLIVNLQNRIETVKRCINSVPPSRITHLPNIGDFISRVKVRYKVVSIILVS